MRQTLTAALAAALMSVPTGCASNSTAEDAPHTRAAHASGSPVSTTTESPQMVKTCAALRKTRLDPTAQIPNPCAQAKHLLELYRHNKSWTKNDGFTLAAGELGPTGLKLMVDGDLTAARTTIGDDPLVAQIHSRDQGL
jgi:hypothetical protein